ncbi:EamA family transporter [Cohnella yongneupensis]|uniref:DMT family transporter n=1 Tax=Cohnella yongneupensis TaxID=425006 RepID=A0ABW0R323_9BACL
MKYNIAVLLGAISYGILSTIVVKAYGRGYTLGEVVGSQLMIGCVLAWALAIGMRGIKQRRESNSKAERRVKQAGVVGRLTWKQRITLLAAGTPSAITGLLYYESLRTISNSLAIVLLFQFTWIGVVFQAIGSRKKPNRITLMTLVVLFGGTLLAAGVMEQGATHLDGRGVALALLSAVSYSLFIMFSGKAVPHAAPATRSAWMITGGMLFVFSLYPPQFLFDGTIMGQLLLFGLLLGFFGAFMPPVLFTYGVPHIGGAMAGILGAAELPVAVLLSSAVLHEYVSPLQWFGIALVLAGVAMPELINRIRHSQPSYTAHSA